MQETIIEEFELRPDQNPEAVGTGWMWFLFGAGVGALATLLLEPSGGGRRRALIRDKTFKASKHAGRAAARTARHLENKAFGMFKRSVHSSDVHVDDVTLQQRVRSEFGRKIRHAKSIDVEVIDGVVTLRGPILNDEVDDILLTVNAVPGVKEVINELDVHTNADSIPGLQGEGKEYLQ
jgi:hypothetical protein